MTLQELYAFTPGGQPTDVVKLAQANLVQMRLLPPELGGDGDWGGGSRMAFGALTAARRGDVLDVAVSQIGAQELPDHQNDGPIVNLYLDQVGLRGSRAPWCAAFVSWCEHRWAENTPNGAWANLPAAGARFLDTAGAWAFEQYDGSNGAKLYRKSQMPGVSFLRRGDIIMYTFSHVGLVLSVLGGVIYAVEGNTNSDGSRDGYEVIKHARQWSQVRSILRPRPTA